MAWQRWGDTIATDPRVLSITPWPRRKAAMGFALLAGSLLAQHTPTGLVLNAGLAEAAGGPQWREDVESLVGAGLLVKVPRRRDQWTLVDDPEFAHIRTGEELDWERQRRRDNANPAVCMPAKLRDGDACRYCAAPVLWYDRRQSARSGTYDHRVPGEKATPDTSVVACRSCNSRRGGHYQAGLTASQVDELIPLLPVPTPGTALYSKATAAQLSRYFGRPIAATDARPDTQSRPAPARAAAVGAPGKTSATPQPAATAALSATPPPAATAATRTRTTSTTTPDSRPVPPAPARAAAAGAPSEPGDDHTRAAAAGAPGTDTAPRSADVSRSTGCGPGRVGSGRVGPPPPSPRGSPSSPTSQTKPSPQTSASPAHRRGGRGGRRRTGST